MLDPLQGHQSPLDLLWPESAQGQVHANYTHIQRLAVPDHLILHLLGQLLEESTHGVSPVPRLAT